MTSHSQPSTLFTLYPLKREEQPARTILSSDFQSLPFAPFGNLVRVRFDFDHAGASRDSAERNAKLLLPSVKGFRHVVIRENARSFVVALAPDEDGTDEIIRKVAHSVRSVVGAGSFSSEDSVPASTAERPVRVEGRAAA